MSIDPADSGDAIVGKRRTLSAAKHAALFRDSQPSHNLFRHRIGSRRDLLRRLVLDRMLHVNRIKARASQRASLHSRGRGEFSCSDGHRRDSQIFQTDGIVQTARCAGPSIRQPFHHRIHATQLFDDLRRRVLGKCRLLCAEYVPCAVLAPQNLFQPVKKEVAARLANIEQANLLAL